MFQLWIVPKMSFQLVITSQVHHQWPRAAITCRSTVPCKSTPGLPEKVCSFQFPVVPRYSVAALETHQHQSALMHCGKSRLLGHGLKPIQVGSSAGRTATLACGQTVLLWDSGLELDTPIVPVVEWVAEDCTSVCWLLLNLHHEHCKHRNNFQFVLGYHLDQHESTLLRY